MADPSDEVPVRARGSQRHAFDVVASEADAEVLAELHVHWSATAINLIQSYVRDGAKDIVGILLSEKLEVTLVARLARPQIATWLIFLPSCFLRLLIGIESVAIHATAAGQGRRGDRQRLPVPAQVT